MAALSMASDEVLASTEPTEGLARRPSDLSSQLADDQVNPIQWSPDRVNPSQWSPTHSISSQSTTNQSTASQSTTTQSTASQSTTNHSTRSQSHLYLCNPSSPLTDRFTTLPEEIKLKIIASIDFSPEDWDAIARVRSENGTLGDLMGWGRRLLLTMAAEIQCPIAYKVNTHLDITKISTLRRLLRYTRQVDRVAGIRDKRHGTKDTTNSNALNDMRQEEVILKTSLHRFALIGSFPKSERWTRVRTLPPSALFEMRRTGIFFSYLLYDIIHQLDALQNHGVTHPPTQQFRHGILTFRALRICSWSGLFSVGKVAGNVWAMLSDDSWFDYFHAHRVAAIGKVLEGLVERIQYRYKLLMVALDIKEPYENIAKIFPNWNLAGVVMGRCNELESAGDHLPPSVALHRACNLTLESAEYVEGISSSERVETLERYEDDQRDFRRLVNARTYVRGTYDFA